MTTSLMKRIRRKGKALPLAILLLTGLHSLANAQEYEKAISCNNYYSIVRHVDMSRRLVWHSGQIKEEHGFTMYEDGDDGARNSGLHFPMEINVLDFYVIDGTVYFCGKRKVSDTKEEAVLGCFNLQGYPGASKVYIIPHDNFSEFRRMTVFTRYCNWDRVTETSVVMTAKTQDGEWTIVDASPIKKGCNSDYEAPQWKFNAMDTRSESLANHCFQDVTVTSNYVIATSSYSYTNTRPGLFGQSSIPSHKRYLWYFPLSETSGTTFDGDPHCLVHSSTLFEETLLVESCGGDDFVTVSLTDASFLVSEHLRRQDVKIDYFSRYDLIQRSYQSVRNVYDGNSDINCKLREIKWNNFGQEMDILVYDSTTTNMSLCSGQIWHFQKRLLTCGNSYNVGRHIFDSHKILSFDHVPQSNCFIASGSPGREGSASILKIFKYNYIDWGSCFETGSFRSEKVQEKTSELQHPSISWVRTTRGRVLISTKAYTESILTYCISNK